MALPVRSWRDSPRREGRQGPLARSVPRRLRGITCGGVDRLHRTSGRTCRTEPGRGAQSLCHAQPFDVRLDYEHSMVPATFELGHEIGAVTSPTTGLPTTLPTCSPGPDCQIPARPGHARRPPDRPEVECRRSLPAPTGCATSSTSSCPMQVGTRRQCGRCHISGLFAYRQQSKWPPSLTAGDWVGRSLRRGRKTVLDALASAAEAVVWFNAFVERITGANNGVRERRGARRCRPAARLTCSWGRVPSKYFYPCEPELLLRTEKSRLACAGKPLVGVVAPD